MLRLGSSTGTKRSPEAEGEDDGQEAASAGVSAQHPSLCYIIRHIRRVVWVTGRAGCAGMSAGNKVTVPFSILFTELQIVMRFYEMNMKWPQVSKTTWQQTSQQSTQRIHIMQYHALYGEFQWFRVVISERRAALPQFVLDFIAMLGSVLEMDFVQMSMTDPSCSFQVQNRAQYPAAPREVYHMVCASDFVGLFLSPRACFSSTLRGKATSSGRTWSCSRCRCSASPSGCYTSPSAAWSRRWR